MRKLVLLAAALTLVTLAAGCVSSTQTAPMTALAPAASSSSIAVTQDANSNVTVSTADGTHTYTKATICGYGYGSDAFVFVETGSPRLPLGRSGPYLTVAGKKTSVNCGAAIKGGSGTQTYVDEWADSSLVEDDGTVTLNPGEEVVEQPSVDPEDEGFEDDGPPSVDG